MAFNGMKLEALLFQLVRTNALLMSEFGRLMGLRPALAKE